MNIPSPIAKKIGNCYSGSLYLGLLSLLENSQQLKAGDAIAFFSYGSGAVAEIFTGYLVDGFQKQLKPQQRLTELAQRKRLSVAEYETLFFEEAQLDAKGNANFKEYQTGPFAFTAIEQHQRIYKKRTN